MDRPPVPRGPLTIAAWLLSGSLACTPAPPGPTGGAGGPEVVAGPPSIATATVEPSPAPPVVATPPPSLDTPIQPPIQPPVQEPTQEPLRRFVAPTAFPDDVFAATVDRAGTGWTVDIVDWEVAEDSPIAAALMSDERALAVLPEGHAALPTGWAKGDPWTLVTRAGTVTRTVESFGITMPEGSGQLFVHVRLGAAPKGATGPAVALRGRAGKAAPRLTRPAAGRPASIDADARARIHAAMVAGFDDESRPRIRGAKLRDRDVELYPGRFPGGRTHLAVVRHLAHDDGEATMLSALLFLHGDGEAEFVRQADVLGEMTLVGLVDLDGDGLDEVVYEDAYHEGWFVELLYWRGEKAEVRVLTGDGL